MIGLAAWAAALRLIGNEILNNGGGTLLAIKSTHDLWLVSFDLESEGDPFVVTYLHVGFVCMQYIAKVRAEVPA